MLDGAGLDEVAERTGGPDGAIRVTGAQLTAALDQLLDSRSRLTRALLGGHASAQAGPTSITPRSGVK